MIKWWRKVEATSMCFFVCVKNKDVEFHWHVHADVVREHVTV